MKENRGYRADHEIPDMKLLREKANKE